MKIFRIHKALKKKNLKDIRNNASCVKKKKQPQCSVQIHTVEKKKHAIAKKKKSLQDTVQCMLKFTLYIYSSLLHHRVVPTTWFSFFSSPTDVRNTHPSLVDVMNMIIL